MVAGSFHPAQHPLWLSGVARPPHSRPSRRTQGYRPAALTGCKTGTCNQGSQIISCRPRACFVVGRSP